MKKTLLLVLCLLAAVATLGVLRSNALRIGPMMPQIISFTANPRVIASGESVTLAWETRGVSSVDIEWGPEYHPRGSMQRRTELPPSGTMTFQPTESTVFVLECRSLAGDACMVASASVKVR